MLGLGWSEILVIAVVALIFVGPKDLPVMLRNVGRAFGTMRRMSNEFTRELNRIAAVDEVKDISRSITSPITQTRAEIAREFNQIRNGKVEPTGKIKPKDGQDDVYEALTEKAGKTASAPPAEAVSESAAGAPAKPKSGAKRTTARKTAAKPAASKSGAKTAARKAKTSASAKAPADPAPEATIETPKRTRKPRSAKSAPAQPVLETAESGDTQ